MLGLLRIASNAKLCFASVWILILILLCLPKWKVSNFNCSKVSTHKKFSYLSSKIVFKMFSLKYLSIVGFVVSRFKFKGCLLCVFS